MNLVTLLACFAAGLLGFFIGVICGKGQNLYLNEDNEIR